MPAPHRSVFFYRPDALPAAQPTASKHCKAGLLKEFFILFHVRRAGGLHEKGRMMEVT